MLGEDGRVRERARSEGQLIYQRSCRPCHGMLGAGDGPYATTFGVRATDLVAVARGPEALGRMFDRIKRGAAALPEAERSAGSAMPAFGDALDDRQIWSVLLVLDDMRALVGRRAASVDPATLYADRCAVCHGDRGGGDGPLAAELFPRPRDFTRAGYRFRSTASGASPHPADLVRTLERGLGDTAMGSFAPLGEAAFVRLAKRLEAFAPGRFAAPAVTVEPPPELPADGATLARGRTLYDDLSCGQCHGKDGRGDGPADLKDEAGHASRPANLTKRWQLKGGASAADLFRSLATGLNGTPMPSYADAAEAADRWALAHYVASLGRPRPEAVTQLQPTAASRALPRDPAAPFWEGMARVAIPLGPQMAAEPRWASPAVDAVEVAVAVSAREIGFLLVWDDRTRDVTNDDINLPRDHTIDPARAGRWRLTDQIALAFPNGRWIWSAGTTAGGSAVRVEGRDVAAPVVEPKEQDEADGRSGMLGLFGRRKAEGGAGRGRISSAASFAFGRWRMVIVAPRRPSDASTESFPEGGRVAFSIQAWDGGAGETGTRHGESAWISLVLPNEDGGSQDGRDG